MSFKAINKRFQDRVRLRSKRATVAAQAPVERGAVAPASAPSAEGREAVSASASPEQFMLARDRAYEEIAKLPNGKTYVGALKKAAKDARFDAKMSFDAALEAYQALKDLPVLEEEK